MNFTPFQKLLPKAAQSYGIGKEYEAVNICQIFRSIIPEIFENKKDAATYIAPGHFRNSEFVVKVSSPAWGGEVIMRKQKIIEEMNRKAGKKIIKNLRTQIESQKFA